MKIVVDSGIPLAKGIGGKKRGTPPVYPFQRMKVGDSFFVSKTARGKPVKAAAMSAACNGWKKHHNLDWHFACRGVKELGVDGVRVWRIV